MRCVHCGNESGDSDQYCGKCGASLSPSASGGPTPPLTGGQYGPGQAGAQVARYDLAAIARPLVVMLWAYLAIEVVAALGGVLVAGATGDMRTPAEALNGLVGLVFFFVSVATGILFMIWQYRASSNCRTMGAHLQVSPGWGVGAYFTPIVCLYRPFQAMKEIWQASADPLHWREQQAPDLIKTWWALWIISCALSQLTFRMSMIEQAPAGGVAAVGILSAITDVFLCPVAIQIVRSITRMQTEPIARPETGPW